MEREKKRFWKEAKMGLGRRTKKFQRKTFKKKLKIGGRGREKGEFSFFFFLNR